MVNNQLLVNANDLPNSFWDPFILRTEDNIGAKVNLYGMIKYLGKGKNVPFEVYNDNETQICQGKYTLNTIDALLGKGEFSINCFNNSMIAKGNIRIKSIHYEDTKGYKATGSIGIGEGTTSDGNQFNFLIGITVDRLSDFSGYLE